MQKGITVIIPSIGRKALLTRALNSLKNQILPPNEIIIINSGDRKIISSDVPEMLVNLTKIINKQHKLGVSSARNLGVMKASFEYVGFLDDDDEWSNDIITNFKNMENKINSFIFFPIIYRDMSGLFKRVRHAGTTNLEAFQKYLLHGNPGIGGSNFIVKKEDFFRVRGFDEKLATSEDRDIVLRLIENGITPKDLKGGFAIANIQEKSLSRKKIWQGQIAFYFKHRELYSHIDILNLLIRIIKIYLIQIYRYR